MKEKIKKLEEYLKNYSSTTTDNLGDNLIESLDNDGWNIIEICVVFNKILHERIDSAIILSEQIEKTFKIIKELNKDFEPYNYSVQQVIENEMKKA